MILKLIWVVIFGKSGLAGAEKKRSKFPKQKKNQKNNGDWVKASGFQIESPRFNSCRFHLLFFPLFLVEQQW